MVKTLRCGRRIPGSNPARCMIFFQKIKHHLKTNMLYCFLLLLLVLHNSFSSSTSFRSLSCCHTTFFLLLLDTVQDSSAIPLVKCGNPPSTLLLLLGSQSCTSINAPFHPSCIPFEETIETIFNPPTSTLSSTHVGVWGVTRNGSRVK